MPTATKSTFSLDPVSLERLNRLARRWQVSKTEVLRRALTAADIPVGPTPEERIAALHELQRLTRERGIDIEKWKRTIKDGRR
ncbi:hypothetical protein BH18VER1_BH18VER1_07810 [soil metagenome]